MKITNPLLILLAGSATTATATAVSASASASVMSIEYFEGTNCDSSEEYIDLLGIQVSVGQCFRQVGTQGTGSSMVKCTGSSVVVEEYSGSVDCTTSVTTTLTLLDGFTSGSSCITTPFPFNKYFATFDGDSMRINCDASDEWYTVEDGRYELSRQTTSLDSDSALDYTKENCIENSVTTEMDYCYLNRGGEVCLPTNSNAGDDSFCTANALTTYAYSSNCLYDMYNAKFVQYRSDNSGAGYMNIGCSGVWDDQSSFVVPYSDCLGCSRFKDLKDESTDVAALVALIVGISIGICICCVCCCAGIFVLMYGTAALCGLCFRKNENSNAGVVKSDPVSPIHTINSPMNPQQQYPQQPVYSEPTAPPAYTYHGGQQEMELIHVQVPPNATSGMMMIVTKSSGEQVRSL
jgi:hypothetical protein